jgi:serine/threonine protein kinase
MADEIKDKYEVIKILGEGSFGKCYLMRDKVKRIQVCVKVIKIKNMPQKERVATQMEVDLLRRLCHPNIVRYHDSFMAKRGASLCISMEYCDGGDLADQIKNARRHLFSEDKILHWFVQMALGLHYMHTNKVLHRDLKTQNVFLLGNGRLVLGDLGISKVLDGTMDFAQTCIGTPYYMSPEIFKNKPYSYKSDVWALGCVLYELTTLNHAFDAGSLNGLAQKIIKGRFSPINSKYSRYLRSLINDMLMVNSTQRPDLDNILHRPFIQKHIINFFSDIARRPSSQKMGEGTMIVRAAVGGADDSGKANLSNDQNMLNLRQQLRDLDLTEDMNRALAPPQAKPANQVEARRLAREQQLALRREEDKRSMVEQAIARLQGDKEARAARAQPPVGRVGLQQYKPAVPRQAGRAAREVERDRPVGLSEREKDRDRYGYGDRDRRRYQYGEKQPSYREREQEAVRARRRREEEEERKALAEAERDRRAEAERGANRRREEQRIAARNREEQRIREEARQKELAREAALEEDRRREEALQKQRLDMMKAKQEAAARRDAQRERERSRQRDEIEQLKRDKLELDRRTEERARLQEQRRRGREEKEADSIFTSPHKAVAVRERDEGKETDDVDSAKAKVLQRKREQQEKEERERKAALLRAEEANRAMRGQAADRQKSQYNSQGASSATSGAEEEGKSRDKGEVDELTERLHNATKDALPPSRYDNKPKVSDMPPPGEDESSSDSDEEIFGAKKGGTVDDDEEEALAQADMIRREEELKAELDMRTQRCAELKRTLKETISYASAMSGDSSGTGKATATSGDDAFDVEDLYGDDEGYADDVPVYSAKGVVSEVPINLQGVAVDDRDSEGITPRKVRPDVSLQVPAYSDLQDVSSPVGNGKLGHRTERLRNHLVKNVGHAIFDEAYRFLRERDGDDTVEDEIEKDRVLLTILGEDKMAFVQDLDQLLFLEQYNLH